MQLWAAGEVRERATHNPHNSASKQQLQAFSQCWELSSFSFSSYALKECTDYTELWQQIATNVWNENPRLTAQRS